MRIPKDPAEPDAEEQGLEDIEEWSRSWKGG
jgi:hypothetical protein